MTYIINNWNEIYENAQSRKVDRLLWVAMPNKHDSFGFRLLMERPNGTALYGAWLLLVQVASRCETRGTLVKNGVTLTPAMIAMLTHAPESIISEMLEVVQSKGIEWISIAEQAASQPSTSQVGAVSQPSTSQVGDGRVSETTQPGTRARAHSSFLPSLLSSSSEENLRIESLVAESAERMYALHPKKQNLVLVPEALAGEVKGKADPKAFLQDVEDRHRAWCQSANWREKRGQFAPKLDRWIADRGYTAWPPDFSAPPVPIDASRIAPYDPLKFLKPVPKEAVTA